MRLRVSSTAELNGLRVTGSDNEGGRIGMDYVGFKSPTEVGRNASKEAVILLEAENPPTGEQPVVLSKDQSGVMIHEAVGHPLEADANWKKQSIMWDKMGQMVSKPFVNIFDDATIPNYRGSLAIDDEGVETENVMLVENGKLVGFLNDRLSAKIMNVKPNGHGRRQSYQHLPIPRMNNTVLGAGNTDPEEIIKSVKKGFYAVSYQGGQVSNTGKFTFSCNLGYLIEDGKLTKPLKNATLIGTNVQILNEISMLGNDTGFFLGSCGKEGQTVEVTCGTPTMKIDKMTVGGA
jgi:TldD protein